MNMKKYFRLILGITLAAMFSSCIEMMDAAQDVPIVSNVSISYKIGATTGFIPKDGTITPDPSFNASGLDVQFMELSTGKVTVGTTDEDGVVTVEVVPGNYSIIITDIVESNGQKYYMNATIPNVALVKEITKEEAMATGSSASLAIRPAKVSSLILSEIYFCGAPGYYFRDQTYQIYNNGDEVEYIDGLCFASLTPSMVFEGDAVPVWPDEEGLNNYVYAEYVWQFPGSGQDYPLQPGESVIICQEARDHTLNNELSLDNSMASWEMWTGNATRNNPDVDDMPLNYAQSLNKTQFLVSVFGGAYCIFRPDDGSILPSDWYGINGQNTCAQVNQTKWYARVPAAWILDGVELLTSLSLLGNKRVPGYIDAGAASVGETYVARPICRKVVDTRMDGTPVFADTNNSTEDFEVMESPQIRRFGQKTPAWAK